MLTGVVDLTAVVVTENVAVVAPAATDTLAGSVATAVLLLVSVTTAPPEGAVLLSVTVPVEEVPPVTAAGFRLTDDKAATDWLAFLNPITIAPQLAGLLEKAAAE